MISVSFTAKSNFSPLSSVEYRQFAYFGVVESWDNSLVGDQNLVSISILYADSPTHSTQKVKLSRPAEKRIYLLCLYLKFCFIPSYHPFLGPLASIPSRDKSKTNIVHRSQIDQIQPNVRLSPDFPL